MTVWSRLVNPTSYGEAGGRGRVHAGQKQAPAEWGKHGEAIVQEVRGLGGGGLPTRWFEKMRCTVY